jgi:hypothetical protein
LCSIASAPRLPIRPRESRYLRIGEMRNLRTTTTRTPNLRSSDIRRSAGYRAGLMPCRHIIRAPSEVDPERVIERPVSSWSTLAHRIRTAAQARRRQDESACGGELVGLAAAPLLLSRTPMLTEDRRSRRLRISDERDAVGAGRV